MYMDLPKRTRCCFCLPLRPGLLLWAYLKIIWCFYLIIFIIRKICLIPNDKLQNFTIELSIVAVYAALLIIEFVLTFVFIVGAHEKSPNLLKVYYLYGIVTLVVSSIMYLIAVGIITYDSFFSVFLGYLHITFELLTLGAAALVLHLYLLSLIRSVIQKIENNELNFANHMIYPEDIVKNKEVIVELETNRSLNIENKS